MRNHLKTALWFTGAALALQLVFVLLVTIPRIFDPQSTPFNGSHHLVLWSMLFTLGVWIVLHRERRQRRDQSLEHQ